VIIVAYKQTQKDQNWLLPLNIKEIIPADHICFLVENFVEGLNYSKFDMIYAGAGNSAYHPRILMKILVQGMLYKIRSSRKLASATRENVIFMHLAEKVHPYFRTIARFRKDKEQVKKNIEKAKNELEKYSLEKVSLSDPECRMMQSKKKFAELSYNVQLGVSKNQIIVSNDVCQDKHDAHQFIPQIKNIQENIKLNEEIKVGADSGYSDAENIKFALDNEINLYVPFYFRERLWMKEKMNTNESRKIYSLRKITVEPVYGHMKQNLGFREFLLRGLEKVKIEMNLISIAHNLGKIHRMMRENKEIMGKSFSYFTLFRNFCVYEI